ncbi:17959_t:CDS:2, partial [Gigaspora margarita]
ELVVLKKSYYNHRGSISTNEEIVDIQEIDKASNHEQDDIQTDEVPQELHAEATESVANEETAHKEKANIPLGTSELPEKEIIAEPSDPLRDELLDYIEVLKITRNHSQNQMETKVAKLQREDTAAIKTPTPLLEFSPNNPYINRNKSEKPVNKLFSTDMNISNDCEPVDTDIKAQNLKKVSSIEMFNKPEPPFTNAPHGKIKIRDIDGYEELVKKYLQVGQPHKVHRNTLHSTPVTSNQH